MGQQDTGRRALLAAVAEQQRSIEALQARIAFIAHVAGISQHVAAIRTMADINNPGQPVPDPSEAAPVATTEQAATAEAHDDPTVLGETPGSVQHLQAETTDNPLTLGESLPTSPFGTPTDVTQPVAGTNTGEIPLPSTRTEVDVRVGNPDDPNPAFPWTIAGATSRSTASLLLARRRIEAGLAPSGPDADVLLAAKIEKDASLSDAMLEHEVRVLSGVVATAGRRRQASRSSVPRSAQGVQRTTPSLAGDSAPVAQRTAAAISDGDAEDLFL
jgi:hypothetical protein